MSWTNLSDITADDVLWDGSYDTTFTLGEETQGTIVYKCLWSDANVNAQFLLGKKHPNPEISDIFCESVKITNHGAVDHSTGYPALARLTAEYGADTPNNETTSDTSSDVTSNWKMHISMGGEALTLKAGNWYYDLGGGSREYIGNEDPVPCVKYIPHATISYTGIANIDSKWNTLAQTIGKVNNGTVDMFAPHTLLFMGIDADKRLGSSDTETTYNFAFNYYTWYKVYDTNSNDYRTIYNGEPPSGTGTPPYSEANFAAIF